VLVSAHAACAVLVRVSSQPMALSSVKLCGYLYCVYIHIACVCVCICVGQCMYIRMCSYTHTRTRVCVYTYMHCTGKHHAYKNM